MLFFIVLVIALAALSAFLKSPKGRGWLGELLVKIVIGKTKPGVQYVINDFKCRVADKRTTQIDHILINSGGVFVIETKNYSGRIYGQEQALEWTQVLRYGKVKHKLYNPLKQNKTHAYHVSNLLENKPPIIPVVVFVQGNINFINAYGVYTLSDLKKLIQSTPEALTEEEMEALYDKLLDANDDSITNAEHISNISTLKNEIASDICPRCGNKLILRYGSKGMFMGCEGYPKCKFTKKA